MILPLEEIDLAPWERRESVTLCHGCFEILHIGHIRHLKAAKALGRVLIVTVTPDRFVAKGHGRPVFPEAIRAEALDALRFVDYVAVNQWPDAVETIKLLRPNIYAKGIEYRGRMTAGLAREKRAVESVGGKLKFVGEELAHSTEIMEKILCA